ncbi:hypothetical protein TNCV_3572761 [Trichonephila clavipes]|nr:hypothetical protein TNCV_3572761 [Trichonephila clavipes]
MSYKNELYALMLSKQNNIASLLKYYAFQPNLKTVSARVLLSTKTHSFFTSFEAVVNKLAAVGIFSFGKSLIFLKDWQFSSTPKPKPAIAKLILSFPSVSALRKVIKLVEHSLASVEAAEVALLFYAFKSRF